MRNESENRQKMKAPLERKKSIALATAGGLGLALLSPSSSMAVSVDGCGDQPTGGTLTRIGDICQTAFDSSGSYSYVLPSGISGLHALLVGAGAGSRVDGVRDGYGGDGGSVKYLDYTAASGGESITLSLGAGGASTVSTTPGSGGDTTSTLSGSTTTAAGGTANAGAVCSPVNGWDLLANGDGAFSAASGGSCETSYGRGVNPSLVNNDSVGNSTPTIFQSLNTEFGAGARVTSVSASAIAHGTGEAAEIFVDVLGSGAGFAPIAQASGSDGGVIFRFTATGSGASSNSNGASVAGPGIFLFIANRQGGRVEDTPVYYGSVSIKPDTAFILSVQSVSNPALTRNVLASGSVNHWGHLDARLELGTLKPGTYKIVMTGTHRLGYPLILTNYISVDVNGKFVSISPESLQPSLS